MKAWVQIAGLLVLAAIAGAILYLIGHTFDAAIDRMTPDGKVPLADAGLFASLLLSFREVIDAIKQIWRQIDRSELTSAISNSAPIQAPNPPTGEQ